MNYKTSGVCSREISFDIVEGKVYNVSYVGGCNGNLQGIGKLVEGLSAEDVIARLEGIRCGGKASSCPDQLTKALRQYMSSQA